MKLILPNQEIIAKYQEDNKVISDGQKGIVKGLNSNINKGDLIKVKVVKIDPMRGFESEFISKFERKVNNIKSSNDNYSKKKIDDSKKDVEDSKRENRFYKNYEKSEENSKDVNNGSNNRINSRNRMNNDRKPFSIKEKQLNQITQEDVGKTFIIKTKVLEIKQTKGPTIFVVYDGTRISTAKGFEKAGERAFPDIKIGDRIRCEVKVSMFDNSVELSIQKYDFLSKKEDEELIKNIQFETEKKVKVMDWNFLIKSDILTKMKPEFEKLAKVINLAIVENRPIYLKHHADCDGLSAGIALERAIIKKIGEVCGEDTLIRYNYKRSLSKAPYYDYFDASRDTAMFLEDGIRFGTKAPLVVVVDFGSSVESLLSYKKLKANGAQIVILDHHQVNDQGKEILLDYVDLLVNPTLYGVDYDFSAGMIATEVAHFITDNIDVDYLAAISGTGDRIESKELQDYIKVAETKGYSIEYIKKLVEVVDFEIYNLKFMEARDYYNSLLTKTPSQEEMVNSIYDEIQKKKQIVLKTIINKKEVIEKNDRAFIKLNLEKDFKREFPTSGRVVGMCSDNYKEKYDKLLCIGYDYDLVVIRAKDNTGFDVHELLEILYKKFEFAQIDGGGHKLVGSLKFIPSALNDILKEIERYYFSLKN